MQPEATTAFRVLYCEDDADNREMVRFILEGDGFEVVCPEDSAEYLRAAKEQDFDVYLLEDVLPGIGGSGICEQIREFDVHTPVVFFSGAAYQHDKDRAMAAGAQAYITKPAQMTEVILILRNTIQTAQVRYAIAHR